MTAKILYIEDNPLNMRLVRKILVSAGYQMVEAIDGFSGVTLAAKEMPDLILMDINLPDIDGLAATLRIKSSPKLSRIPVIALTANTMHGDRERFIAAGCDGYIPKPVARNELLMMVHTFLHTAPANRQVAETSLAAGR
ncbi:MAG: response regulator [Armatimonadetes bacterium]|nr:response regulator [Anaerolineae bacterium]